MSTGERIQIKRDCDAVQIPSGNLIHLAAGSEVKVTQSLGDSYTVVTGEGYLVRIGAKDADALGKDSASQPSLPEGVPRSEQSVEKMVWEQLKTCYDPEIPVNIVDLGLIYVCEVPPLPEGGYKVEIKLTLTAPGCGMGEVLRQDILSKVQRIPGVKTANVQLVWEPHWDQSRMSEAAKLQLGFL